MSQPVREVKPLSHPAHVANALRKALREAHEIDMNSGTIDAAVHLVQEIDHIILRLTTTDSTES